MNDDILLLALFVTTMLMMIIGIAYKIQKSKNKNKYR